MKKYLFQIASFTIIALLIQSCDKVTPPFSEQGGNANNSDTVRKILLEDFTGHTCKNCPDAHREAQKLLNSYGNQLIVVAIHGGDFSYPETHPDSSYAYDFRTPEGDQLNADYGLLSWPKGMINRKDFGSGVLLDWSAWGTTISSSGLMNSPRDASIKITNNYNSSSRNLDVTVDTKFLKSFTGDCNLVVYLIEDSIITWQKDNSMNVPDYVHRHVFRHSLNGTYGQLLATGPIANDSFTKNYSYTLPAKFNENHCAIVAFISQASNKEVVQAQEEKIIP